MMNVNIRDQVMSQGLGSIGTIEKKIADAMKTTGEMSQLDLIKLQQQTTQYSNTITMMTNILKNLGDSDKEVIRNC